jgi:hypothetical protein
MKKLFVVASLLAQHSICTNHLENDKMHSKLTFTITHVMVSLYDRIFTSLKDGFKRILRLIIVNLNLTQPFRYLLHQ